MHQVTQVNIDARSPIPGASFSAKTSIKAKAPKEKTTIRVVQAMDDESALPMNTEYEDVPAVVATSLLSENPNDPAVRSNDEAHAIILELASLGKLDYALKRKTQAKRMLMSVSTLDDIVKDYKDSADQSGNRPYSVVEPHPEPVDLATVLNEIQHVINKHILLEPFQAIAVTLWVAFTWIISVVDVAPLLLIGAPERACGKTQLLELLDYLACRSLTASSMRTATLFRIVEEWYPTLLIDEIDTFIKSDKEIAGLLNAGHTRATAFAYRATGKNHAPTRFNVFGAKALAGISPEKHLPEATISRSIFVEMRRKKPDESVVAMRDADKDQLGIIKSKLARVAEDYADQVRNAKPDMPESLDDRSKDNWLPLLAIAQCAGKNWLAHATDAAVKLSASTQKAASIGEQLLADIRRAFEVSGSPKIRRDELIMKLCEDDEAAWATFDKGRPITSKQFADMLSGYGISSCTVRFGAAEVVRGYKLDQFIDVFARYLPTAVTPLQANQDVDVVVANEGIAAEAVTVSDKRDDATKIVKH